MDVKIKCEEGNFKMRGAGLIVKEGKLLTVDICNNGFYCLPGGHVHLGESSLEAIKREMEEEVNLTCKEAKLLAIIENFFTGKENKKYHEVCYFYLYQPNEEVEVKDYSRIENDEGELKNLDFKWLELKNLPNENFRPSVLQEKLAKGDFEFEHIIFGD